MNDRPRQGGAERRGPRPGQEAERLALSQDEIQKILQRGAEDIDRNARQIAQRCAGLSRSQVRNFYGPIVRLRSDLTGPQTEQLHADHARALYMHSARLAYMAARDGKAKDLYSCFDQIVRVAVKNNKVDYPAVATICDFAEAVVAYHYAMNRESRG